MQNQWLYVLDGGKPAQLPLILMMAAFNGVVDVVTVTPTGVDDYGIPRYLACSQNKPTAGGGLSLGAKLEPEEATHYTNRVQEVTEALINPPPNTAAA